MSVNADDVIPASDPAPAADPALAADPAPATDPAADPAAAAAAADRDDRGRFRNPVQPRIDELTKKAREAEREAAFWKARAEASAAPAPKPAEKPTPEKFDDYGAYVEALTDWKADEKVRTAFDARDAKAAETKQVETRQSNWQTRKAEAIKAIPDLDAVLQASTSPVSQFVEAELLESEFGPQIAYQLAKDEALAQRLAGMTEKQVAKEIGRLEATIGAAAKPAADPDPADPDPAPAPVIDAKTTKAPPPVKPIGQGRSTTIDLAKVGMDEYVKTRISQGASWARR